jgi:hypothetical protein
MTSFDTAIRLLQYDGNRHPLLETPGKIVAALDELEARGGEQGAEYAQAVYKKFPGLENYDASGNWIGSIANENGVAQ